MLTEDTLFILVLLRWSREQVEGVEGGGRGTETEKRWRKEAQIVKCAHSSCLSFLPQRLYRSAVS